jgi:HEAT repeat protein
MKRTASASLLLGLWLLAASGNRGQVIDPASGLVLALKARDFEPRYEAAVLLGRLGPKAKAVVPNLVEVMRNDEIGEVRFEAAKALGQIGAREALPALREALKDPDYLVRVFVAEALVKIDPDQDKVAVAALVECLRYSRQEFAEVPSPFVYQALAKLGPRARPAESVVMEGLKDRDLMNRLYALVALEKMGTDDSRLLPLLVAILTDPHHDLLAGAVARGGASFLAPLLVGRFGGNQDEFRRFLFELDEVRELGRLNRERAAVLLGKLGPKAADAVPALEAATRDADPQVCKAARAALEQVRHRP